VIRAASERPVQTTTVAAWSKPFLPKELLDKVSDLLAERWKRNAPGLYKNGAPEAEVTFVLRRDGSVGANSIVIKRSSVDKELDNALTKAVAEGGFPVNPGKGPDLTEVGVVFKKL
jgi:hypothetical protein